MGRTHDALEWAERMYHQREWERYRTEFLMEKLHKLAVAPLSLIDRLQELREILEDPTIPMDHLMNHIAEFHQEMSAQGGAQFEQFMKEAEPVEQELLRRLEQLRGIRDLAQLVCTFIASMFRPVLMSSDGPSPRNDSWRQSTEEEKDRLEGELLLTLRANEEGDAAG